VLISGGGVDGEEVGHAFLSFFKISFGRLLGLLLEAVHHHEAAATRCEVEHAKGDNPPVDLMLPRYRLNL